MRRSRRHKPHHQSSANRSFCTLSQQPSTSSEPNRQRVAVRNDVYRHDNRVKHDLRLLRREQAAHEPSHPVTERPQHPDDRVILGLYWAVTRLVVLPMPPVDAIHDLNHLVREAMHRIRTELNSYKTLARSDANSGTGPADPPPSSTRDAFRTRSRNCGARDTVRKITPCRDTSCTRQTCPAPVVG